MTVECPECGEELTIKPNGHGRCETCGTHVKILNEKGTVI